MTSTQFRQKLFECIAVVGILYSLYFNSYFLQKIRGLYSHSDLIFCLLVATLFSDRLKKIGILILLVAFSYLWFFHNVLPLREQPLYFSIYWIFLVSWLPNWIWIFSAPKLKKSTRLIPLIYLSSIYLDSGIGKLLPDPFSWIQGTSLQGYLLMRNLVFAIPQAEWLASFPLLCALASIFILVFELSFLLVCLEIPRMEKVIFTCGILFHLLAQWFLRVEFFFPYVFALYVFVFPEEWIIKLQSFCTKQIVNRLHFSAGKMHE